MLKDLGNHCSTLNQAVYSDFSISSDAASKPSGQPDHTPASNTRFEVTSRTDDTVVDGKTFQAYSMLHMIHSLGQSNDEPGYLLSIDLFSLLQEYWVAGSPC